jgi:S-disulfanyl-L-cysteine oxidoreductase SoxD
MQYLNCKFLLVPVMVLMAWVATAPRVAAQAQGRVYENLGRIPTEEEIKGMDISIGPEGKGLPEGSGTAKQGAVIFAQKCQMCHGPTAEESKLTYARLVGGQGSLTTDDPIMTPGSTWPYATSIWDFIRRAMPEYPVEPLPKDYLWTEHPVPSMKGAGSGGCCQVFDMKDDGLLTTGVNPNLTFDQIYALTAFILFRNNIIKEDDVMNRETLPKVVMPNRSGFLPEGPKGKEYDVPVWKRRDPSVRLAPHVSPNSKPLPPGSKPVNEVD